MATGNIPPPPPPPPPPKRSWSSWGFGTSPCAACKYLRRKCVPGCVFAPHFPIEQPNKFISVHKVFGTSNVSKILNDLHPSQRADAVASLTYEAEYRLRDPIYGCVSLISVLQQTLKDLHGNLGFAKDELAAIHQAVVQQQQPPPPPILSNQLPQYVQEFGEQQQPPPPILSSQLPQYVQEFGEQQQPPPPPILSSQLPQYVQEFSEQQQQPPPPPILSNQLPQYVQEFSEQQQQPPPPPVLSNQQPQYVQEFSEHPPPPPILSNQLPQYVQEFSEEQQQPLPILSNQLPQYVQEFSEQQQYEGGAGPSSVMVPSELGLGLTLSGTPAHALSGEHIQLQEQIHWLLQQQVMLEAAHQQALGSTSVMEQEVLRRFELQKREQQMMEGHRHHHNVIRDGSMRELALLEGLELHQQLQQQHLQEQAGGEGFDVGLGLSLLGDGQGDESVAEPQASTLALGQYHHHQIHHQIPHNHREELFPSSAIINEEELLYLEQQRRRHGKQPMCEEGGSNCDGFCGGGTGMGFLSSHE